MTSPSPMTGDEMFDSLTGFDEIAITKKFGKTISQLAQADELQFTRALIFIDYRRRGQKDDTAYEGAMTLPIDAADGRDAVMTYFAKAQPEIMPESPVTDQGKGDSPSN